MTKLKIILVGILIAFFNLNVHAQGVKIYKSDKEVITIPYSELDSIVAYDTTNDLKPDLLEWVDLGLPSGVKWANMNVGATKPEEYGDYFAWGETSPKSSYDESNSLTNNKTKPDFSGNPQYDAATANWGAPARMPKKTEIQELVDNCTTTWTTLNGVNGRLVTGPNGKSIFLPATGYWSGTSLGNDGLISHYWSSTPCEFGDIYAYILALSFESLQLFDVWDRCYGQPVRPVRD